MILLCSTMGALVLTSCAGGGANASHEPGVVPSSAQQSTMSGTAAAGRVPGDVRRTQSTSAPSCSGVGGGSFVGGADGNIAANSDSFVGGGYENQACDEYSAIAGGSTNIISHTNSVLRLAGFIGAGEFNVVTGGGLAAVIGGGVDNTITAPESGIVAGGYDNINDQFSLIGAGLYDTIATGAQYSAIAAGRSITVSGEYAFDGAGISNTVSGEGAYIAAGGYNTASGEGAVVDGGFNSTASGTFATIPGGYVNSAAGTYSFAAGARASAAQTGTFVWSDGSDGDTILTSSRAYQFLARASGGFTLYTNAASTVGAQLAAGSGTWASLSDRNAKSNIVPLDEAAVLEKVAGMPISRWSYKTEHGVRHAGPMAQDFYAAFGLGEDDKHITAIDEDGVALAAIKALHARVGALDAKAAAQAAEIARLRARLAAAASQSAGISAMQRQLQRLSTEVAALRER
ncbi:MAG TPA: tail fiber domain-containing protein [Candidatus Elarobacter sp.]|nr:tail fiber domain-containing protein [Candidatus Elarobacter sp.]